MWGLGCFHGGDRPPTRCPLQWLTMLQKPAAAMQYPVTQRAFGLAIFVLSGLQLMVVLDGSVVILALPRLQQEMGLSSSGSA